MVTTGIAIWKYGAALRYNLLQGLPAGTLLYVDLLLVTVQIALSMVVGGSALFQDIEDTLNIPRGACRGQGGLAVCKRGGW